MGGGMSRSKLGTASTQAGTAGRMGDASFSIHEVRWPFDCQDRPV